MIQNKEVGKEYKERFLVKIGEQLKYVLPFRSCSLISRFMTSQPSYQTITIYVLLYISRIKVKQTMKFGQLIEYNKRDIFLQKSYRK